MRKDSLLKGVGTLEDSIKNVSKLPFSSPILLGGAWRDELMNSSI